MMPSLNLHNYLTEEEHNILFNENPEQYNNHIEIRDGYAVPIPLLQRTLKHLQSEYGESSTEYIIFLTLVLTGCRIAEIQNFDIKLTTAEGQVSWKLGKNQKQYRSLKMPEYWWRAVRLYRQEGSVKTKLFRTTGEAYSRKFCDMRKQLEADWQRKSGRPMANMYHMEYEHQLKGIRKTFATFKFYQYLKEHGSAELAMQLTAKQMKHKTTFMTVRHYLEDIERLRLQDYEGRSFHDLFSQAVQTRLI